MKYNDNGEYKDIYVKAFDTLPIGTEVDYDGSTVPSGWTEVTRLYESSISEFSLRSHTTATSVTDMSITANRSGLALVILYGSFEENTNGYRFVAIRKGDTNYGVSRVAPATGTQTATISIATLQLTEGDIITPRVAQNSGSALNCDFNMQLVWL